MKYVKLEQMARGLTPEETADSLRSLANDNRFAAVVRVVMDHKEQYADSYSKQSMAGSHGALAHAAGSVYALNLFLGTIKQLTDPPKKTTPQPPPARR